MRSTPLVLVAAALLTFLASACGGSDGGAAAPASGAEIYEAVCATCHGANGGGFVGPPLVGVHDRLPVAEIESVIANGRTGESGAMPAWGNRYSPEEIASVAEHLRTFG